MIRLVALMLCLAGPLRAEQVVVFAAASLAGPLDEVAAAWEAETGHEVVISYGGSAAMAQQIRQGAPADLFISANEDWMDVLEAEGLILPGSRADLLTNRLVLIRHGPTNMLLPVVEGLDLKALLDGGKLAMGLTTSVPAGIYGRAALEHFGLWDDVAGQVAEVDSVRAALMLVALGEAPLGIVYETDARTEPRVSVIATFPEDSHPPIVYPLAEIAGNGSDNASFLRRYLVGADARRIFESHGFGVPSE